ncbi:MAG: N-acetylmuramoyl-L-alanine amidase [Bacteroidetes bacterium]|jgi:N-acetylmuramoyl-L-alanine amidase|nr:N-acetylmuramoyl-L-alanine amidase [Bacteroidota bacterium]
MLKKLVNYRRFIYIVKLSGLFILWSLLIFFCLSFSSVYVVPKPKGIKIVVIDAGHGGKDPGCNGATHNEKQVTLAIALKLGKLIEENLKDVKVIYTRKTDVFVELEERAQIANRNNADLFISIHCNAAAKYVTYKGKDGKVHYKTWKDKKGKIHKKEVANPGPYGSETYVMGIKNEKGKMEVAKRENAAMLLEDNYEITYDGFDPNSDEAYIIMTMGVKVNVEQSAKFAARIQEEYKAKAGRIDKGVQRQSIWVLWRTTMPSILTEVGFLTNPQEEKFLASEKGQNYMAIAIFKAFRKYKDDQEGKSVRYDDEYENQEPIENENLIYEREHPKGEDSAAVEETDTLAQAGTTVELKVDDKTTEKYNSLKKAADDKLKEKKFAEAKKIYEQALEVKKDDAYAKSKIEEIDKGTEEAEIKKKEEEKNKANAEAEAKYKTLIEKADKLLKEKKWQDAKKAYIDAAVFKPGDKYPKQKIAEIETIQKEIEAKQNEQDSADIKPKDILSTYSGKKDSVKKETKDLVEFRVQFTSSDKELAAGSPKLKGLENVTYYKAGAVLKYTAGSFPKPDDAIRYQAKVRELGHKDAFVVAFKNGVRIDYKEALKLVQ